MVLLEGERCQGHEKLALLVEDGVMVAMGGQRWPTQTLPNAGREDTKNYQPQVQTTFFDMAAGGWVFYGLGAGNRAFEEC